MAERILWSGSTVLPAPVEMSIDDEIIWSSSTGRSAAGYMIGDVVAEKKTIDISWAFITEEELAVIKNIMIAGFFPISFRDDGIDMTIESYRGTLSKEVLGDIGDGHYWYKSAKVTVIQR